MFQRGVAVRVLGDLTPLPEDIHAQIREVDEIADRLGPDAAHGFPVHQLRRTR